MIQSVLKMFKFICRMSLAHIFCILVIFVIHATTNIIKFPGPSGTRTGGRPSALSTESQIALLLTRTGSINRRDFNLREGDTCSSPEGKTGVCSRLRECPEIVSFVRRNSKNRRRLISYVVDRLCEKPAAGRGITICCASKRPSVTSGGGQGDKVEIPSECGRSDAVKVTFGTEIAIGSHPWLAAVGYQDRSKGKFEQTCGGTIITRRHVLSASHCFHGRGIRVVPDLVILGEHSLTDDEFESPKQRIIIAEYINENYGEGAMFENDIELLKLANDIKFEHHIQPACLPRVLTRSEDFEGFEDLEGEFLSVVGWGSTESAVQSDVPIEAKVSVVGQPRCRAAYPISTFGVDINNKKICAGTGRQDSCQGDSGGPLLYTDTKVHFRVFVVGIVSFGTVCGSETHPGVYTKVENYLDWIERNL